ncbi:helix-turn-helix domain-containing protein [Chelativorans sp. AA-79]|uniref:winged helix-turn-helix transcriptional regulator n=1 Tax=Chelativorans sp. AA-79 TaxID=3028735 RepID=UPI0023F6F0A5|nr:helix-turn-helix domain-containing protein [Chelativorans sp. AA-79]WEX11181.1 helix-turn-helix domain-containing protein [Chelativorans sp. AA-79]
MAESSNYDACRPVHELLSLVGDKWTMQVVRQLGNGTMRFNQLRRAIDGISQKMLTTTLRNLERDGFVTRTIYPTIPPRVDYSLTDLGRDLLVPISALGEWVVENRYRIEEARTRFDRQQV